MVDEPVTSDEELVGDASGGDELEGEKRSRVWVRVRVSEEGETSAPDAQQAPRLSESRHGLSSMVWKRLGFLPPLCKSYEVYI